MNKCKNCKFFDNTQPVSTVRGSDRPKVAEEYIGKCKQIGRIKMMNDFCPCFSKKEEK